MSLHSQILAAEIARIGARIDFEDSALAPFAADLAGANGCSSDDHWRLTGLGRGLCRVVPSVQPEGPPVLAIGDVPVLDAAFWLHPPAHAHLPGWTPIDPAMPEFLTRRRENTELLLRLRKLMALLQDEQQATGNWIRTHLEAKSCLLAYVRLADDCDRLELDPFSALAPMRQADALAYAARGALRLTRGVPLQFRVPTLGVRDSSVQLSVRASGEVRLKAAEQVRVARRIVTSDGLQRFELRPRAAAPWLDFALLGNSGHLESVALMVPCKVSGMQEEQEDILGIYADPLDAYASGDHIA